MKTSKIILIGNYPPDGQESMKRFTLMLQSGFIESGVLTEIWLPVVFFGKLFKSTISGPGKWFGYIDKWIIFPIILKLRTALNKSVCYHVCDHSNAPYIPYLPKSRSSITCHDVLAIRGALGHQDAYCPASSTGKILQKWILKNLLKSKKIASVSHFTHNQLVELNNGVAQPGWHVVHNGFNASFKVMPDAEVKAFLVAEGQRTLLEKPYIMHVGSNLPRKNREMLIKMVATLDDKWSGNICFTGQVMDDKLQKIAQRYNLKDRIVEIKKPNHAYLEALINGAQAFIFPSFSEGFGWPVIEAQACGTPVIVSNLAPMPEVGGEGAWYANPYEPGQFAEKLLEIVNGGEAYSNRVAEGLKNTNRFNSALMNERYLNLIKS